MIKLFAVILVLFIASAAGSHAQDPITTVENDGVFCSESIAQISDNPRSTGRIGQRKNIKLNSDPKESYTMFGVVLGTPGGINLLWGLQDKNLGVRLSGGVIFGPCDVAAGFQTNFVYNLQKSKYFEQSLSIGVGLSDGLPSFSEAVYYGIFYSGNAFGLFAEIGLVTTIRGFPTPHVIGHLGYVWRFN